VSATKRSCQIKNIQRASGGMDRKELVHFAVVESLLLSSNRWCPYVTKPLRTSGKTGCLAPSEKKPVLLDRTAPPRLPIPEHVSPTHYATCSPRFLYSPSAPLPVPLVRRNLPHPDRAPPGRLAASAEDLSEC
jgi:hypothetical protein